MSYETYRMIFHAGALVSVLLLAVAVFLFFKLKIPKVINNLTGKDAKKAIANMNEYNSNASQRLNGRVAMLSQKPTTDRISQSGRIIQTAPAPVAATEKIATQKFSQTTTLLAEETTILSPETTILSPETTVLSPEEPQAASPETTVLSAAPAAEAPNGQKQAGPETAGETTVLGISFSLLEDITFTHTNEII